MTPHAHDPHTHDAHAHAAHRGQPGPEGTRINTAQQVSRADGGYLGAAVVVHARGRALRVRLVDGREVAAALALAVPYEPLRRDEVLVLGEGARFFVIGVLSGRGRLSLCAEELTLRARGRLLLEAKEAIRLRGRRLEALLDGELAWQLGDVHKQSRRWMQLAAGRVSLLARDAHQLVRRSWHAQAKSADLKVKDAFHINGKTVRLG